MIGDSRNSRRRVGTGAVGMLLLSSAVAVAWTGGPVPHPSLSFTQVLSGDLPADTFSSPSASWVDLDGDGDEDLYVLNGYASLERPPTPQPNVVYRNDGGVLVRIPDHPLARDPAFSGSATWGDYDVDGDLDVFVANQSDADNFLFRNDGGGTFTRITTGAVVEDGGRSFSATWIDIDGDGCLDLHVMNGRDGGGGQVDFLYRNVGGGGFERVRGLPLADDTLPSGGAAWGDFDRDGDPDVYLPVNAPERPRFYRNDGAWHFTEIGGSVGLTPDPLPGWPGSSVGQWVDLDHDGDLDLFAGHAGGVVDFLYENDGEGRLGRATAGRVGLDATYVSDVLWVDLDNDADLDLVIAVWGGASEIYLNDGDGDMHPVETGDFGADIHFASSVSASDVDGDGLLDLFITQWPINEEGGAPNLLFRNDGPARSWLRIRLEGRESGRSGIGAEVTVIAEIDGAPRRQLRIVSARSSWRSANGLTQHFGLADARHVDRVEVRWPTGRVQTIDGPIAVNRRLEIVEEGGRTAGCTAAAPTPNSRGRRERITRLPETTLPRDHP